MSKPEDIPQDIWDKAEACFTGNSWNPLGIERVARAILAAKAEEREACIAAANAERVLPFYVNPEEATEGDKAYDMAIDHVLDAIRKRGGE